MSFLFRNSVNTPTKSTQENWDKSADAGFRSFAFNTHNTPVQERRLSSSSSNESSESAAPFRPWTQGGEVSDSSSTSPSSVKSMGASGSLQKNPDYYYPEFSNSSPLKLMTEQVMSSLNSLSCARPIHA